MAKLYVGNKEVSGIKPPGSDTVISLKGKRVKGINVILNTTTLSQDQFALPESNAGRYPGIRTFTLKDGTTTIPQGCFRNFASLEYMVIPESVVNFGDYAFKGCSSLKDVYFKSNTPTQSADGREVFGGLTLTVHYPSGSSQWEVFKNMCGNRLGGAIVTWEASTI